MDTEEQNKSIQEPEMSSSQVKEENNNNNHNGLLDTPNLRTEPNALEKNDHVLKGASMVDSRFGGLQDPKGANTEPEKFNEFIE